MPNRLAQETSPYLQQHADNPVDWYPWGPEALERARSEGKPILLSVGYSACHWCHVMAHESFEDPQIAQLMNSLFINVKVDREERPDLDQIYQLALRMLNNNGSGGWPLTVFLTPDQVPMFAGTYFPKTAQYNLPAFPDVCQRVAGAFVEHRAELRQHSDSISAAFKSMLTAPVPANRLGLAPAEAFLAGMKEGFDPRAGGMGQAPKFPHPVEFEFALRRAAGRGKVAGDTDSLHIVRHTLERMALGGIFDQLGGGFARYSVDANWTIPHFEKMLYDNGQLLRLYADTWALTKEPLLAKVAEETAGWILREMTSPEGGYYASIDADSEGEEGTFYVWTREQVKSLLSDDEYAVAAPHYGLDAPANFEGRHWHLNVMQSLGDVAQRIGRPVAECESLRASARSKLFAAREKRVRPGRDEKILASWNGLAIAGMARAGSVFGRPEWVASARRALDFIRANMWRDGKLLASYKDGRANLNAYLDDHAYLLHAAIELLQAEFDTGVLAFAVQLADSMLARFQDQESGAFYFTSHDHERLFTRIRPSPDNDKPSGNGWAALSLVRLGHITGDTRYTLAAEHALRCLWPVIEQHAGAHASLLMAVEEHLDPTRVVVLRGARAALVEWQRDLAQRYLGATIVLAVPDDARGLPDVLDKPVLPAVNAWVCEGVSCLAPIASMDELRLTILKSSESA